MTVIYKNQAYRFIGYANLPGTEVTAERGSRFYRLPVKECQLMLMSWTTGNSSKNVTAG